MDLSREQKEQVLLQIISRWAAFQRLMQFKTDVSLAQKIRLFEGPCFEFFSRDASFSMNVEEHVMLARALIILAIESTGSYPRGAVFEIGRELGWAPVTHSPSIFTRFIRWILRR